MLKKLLIGMAVVVLAAGVGAWFFRIDLFVKLAEIRAHKEVAPTQSVPWSRGADVDSDQPNIIVILMDDLAISDVSGYGSSLVPTPNIDRLAAEGAHFTNAYAAHANCAPSRAALMTGRDSSRTGFDITPMPDGSGKFAEVVSNAALFGRQRTEYFPEIEEANPTYADRGLPGSEITIAEVLKDVGYHTMHIGKWHLGTNTDSYPTSQGFNETLFYEIPGLYLPEDHPDVVNAKLDFSTIDRFQWATGSRAVKWNDGEWFAPDEYVTDYFTTQAERAIEANANRPFFLYLAHWGPHTPLQATRADYEAVGDIQPHRARVYAAMIRSLDRSVERIMGKLEDLGIADNTIVVFASDNGGPDYLDIDGINAPYRGWKTTFFEGGIRVPMAIKWPGSIDAGTEVDAAVNLLDLMPTLVEAAGGQLPGDREFDGRNLAPLWNGATELTREDNAMFWAAGSYRVVRSGGWKLQLNPDSGQTFLYDLTNDPTEKNNLAESNVDKVAALTALIEEHYANAERKVGLPVIEFTMTIDKNRAQDATDDDAYVRWRN